MIKVHWLMYLTDPVWQGLFYNHLRDWFIHSLVIELSFPPNLQDIINPKPLKLGTWNFGSMFPSTICHMSHVRCQVSDVRCHVSHVMCQMSHVFFSWTNWRSLLVDGLLSTGPTLSSLQTTMVLNAIIEIIIEKKKKQTKIMVPLLC